MEQKIVFIGAGSMAEAIIAGLVKSDPSAHERVFVTNKNNAERLTYLEKKYRIQRIDNREEIIPTADMLVLAMKPKDMMAALSSIKKWLHPEQIVFSVLAGISTRTIVKELGKDIPVIRVMPNTSAIIGQSATALAKGEHAQAHHLETAHRLFHTIGKTITVEEADMHAVTSISGSGPAYVYYLVEAMQKAAMDAGLEQDIAEQLVKQTIIGVGEMLKVSEDPVHVLRENITSPQGTTEAGLDALKRHGFEKAVMACVEDARKRSIEIAGEDA